MCFSTKLEISILNYPQYIHTKLLNQYKHNKSNCEYSGEVHSILCTPLYEADLYTPLVGNFAQPSNLKGGVENLFVRLATLCNPYLSIT